MDSCSVKGICQVRTTRASLFPARTEHEVVHDQLAAAFEHIGERFLSVYAFEYIFLFNLFPWHLAPLAAEVVAQAREFLLFGKQLLACGKPLRRWHDFRCGLLDRCCRHDGYSFSFESLFSIFFLRKTFRTRAVTPPVETALPRTTPALAMHAGHINASRDLFRLGSSLGLCMDVVPTLVHAAAMIFLNRTERLVVKLDQRAALRLDEPVLQV